MISNKKNQNNFFNYLIVGCLSIFLFSCSTSKKITKESFIYFQNSLDSIKYIQSREPIIQNNDLLSIQVLSTSLNQEQTIPFNPVVSSAGSTSGYLVNAIGYVDMPVIGPVRASGLTQIQLQKNIVEKLNPYVKDPSVVVHFLQFKVNVMGEVKAPGTKKFDADRVTIIDAISASGDLTDLGKREDIMVIREEGNTRKIYKMDIRSGGMFQSPAYLLQANDIIYVGATDAKFGQLKLASKSAGQGGLQMFITILGLLTSIAFTIRLFK